MMQTQIPIFRQLANKICDDIVREKYRIGDRIPSVRELAVDCEVNPNTVVKSFDWLSQSGIIYNKRGLGYFVSENAKELILQFRRKQFTEQYLPEVFAAMNQLGISAKELDELYQQWIENQKQGNEL